MAMYGADVTELRALAARFDRTADQLDTNRMAVGNAIQVSAWVGPFATRFRAEWNSEHSARIHNAAQALRANAGRLRHNADEQANASAVDGLATLADRTRFAASATGLTIGGALLTSFAAAKAMWDSYGEVKDVIGTAKAGRDRTRLHRAKRARTVDVIISRDARDSDEVFLQLPSHVNDFRDC